MLSTVKAQLVGPEPAEAGERSVAGPHEPLRSGLVLVRRPLKSSSLVVAFLLPVTLLAAAHPVSVAGDDTGPQIVGFRVGFGGTYKIGCWTAAWITVRAGEGPLEAQLELIVPDGEGVPARFVQEEGRRLALRPGETVTVRRLVKPGRARGGFGVQLRQGDRVLATRRFPAGTPVDPDRPLLLTLGPSIGEEQALARRFAGAEAGPAFCRLDEAADLPEEWLGYEGINVMVLPTSQRQPLASLRGSQLAAIQHWVQMGGRLVLCVGSRGGEVFSDAHGLARFAPGRFVGPLPLANVSALETFAGASQPLQVSAAGGPHPQLVMSLLAEVQGRVDLQDIGPKGPLPMIVRQAFGFGQVVFVAFDLDQPPFSMWRGRPRLVARLLQATADGSEEQAVEGQRGRMVHVGYNDITGQLRTALDQFRDAPLMAFGWVAGLILLYVALLGPGDYFFLKRCLGRMRWTWATFPLLVLAFTGTAVLLHRQFKGRQLAVNQVDLVDIDMGSKWARGTTWDHVYSPQTRAYGLEVRLPRLERTLSIAGNVLCWQGLPGRGLGGMNASAIAAPAAGTCTIAFEGACNARMRDAAIEVASTKSLVGRWWGKVRVPGEARLSRTPDGLLQGTIVNPLPVPLTECMLAYENWVYRLDQSDGKLAPHQTAQLELERPYNLEWRLTRRRVQDTQEVMAPWDQASHDVPRIMEMIMFHGAAGGADYTRLRHRYQGYLDLSDHLHIGCAVLWGRSAQPAADLVFDGGRTPARCDRHWTFYRIVFPVAQPTPSTETDPT